MVNKPNNIAEDRYGVVSAKVKTATGSVKGHMSTGADSLPFENVQHLISSKPLHRRGEAAERRKTG